MYLVDICIYYHFKKDKRTEADRSICFNLIFLGCFCFIPCRFQASKPMWKLYLVWAILSSVTLLYIISKRCNVMSTIKTHKMAPVGSVSSGFACFCRCDWTRPSIDEKASQIHSFHIFFSPFTHTTGVKFTKSYIVHCLWILTGLKTEHILYSFVSLVHSLFLAGSLTAVRCYCHHCAH